MTRDEGGPTSRRHKVVRANRCDELVQPNPKSWAAILHRWIAKERPG